MLLFYRFSGILHQNFKVVYTFVLFLPYKIDVLDTDSTAIISKSIN